MFAGPHAPQYQRKSNVIDYSAYHSCLFPVLSTWTGYWTTFDEAIGRRPGLATTTVVGDVVDSWTDQRSGFVIPGLALTQRPDLAVDGTALAGREVVQCAVTGTKAMNGDLGLTVLASGVRPYMIVVCRNRSAPASQQRLFELGNLTATNLGWNVGWRVSTADAVGASLASSNVVELAGGSLTQSAYVHEAWVTAAGGSFVRKNGNTSAVNAAGTNGVPENITRLSVGCSRVATVPADASIAEIHLFTAYPGDTIALRLVNLIMRKWVI